MCGGVDGYINILPPVSFERRAATDDRTRILFSTLGGGDKSYNKRLLLLLLFLLLRRHTITYAVAVRATVRYRTRYFIIIIIFSALICPNKDVERKHYNNGARQREV